MENVSRQNSIPDPLIFFSSTISWIIFLSGVISIPPSDSLFFISEITSPSVFSLLNNRSIHTSSTSITRENVISLQIFSACFTPPMQINAPSKISPYSFVKSIFAFTFSSLLIPQKGHALAHPSTSNRLFPLRPLPRISQVLQLPESQME